MSSLLAPKAPSPASKAAISSLFRGADTDGDGLLTQDEFQRLILQTYFANSPPANPQSSTERLAMPTPPTAEVKTPPPVKDPLDAAFEAKYAKEHSLKQSSSQASGDLAWQRRPSLQGSYTDAAASRQHIRKAIQMGCEVVDQLHHTGGPAAREEIRQLGEMIARLEGPLHHPAATQEQLNQAINDAEQLISRLLASSEQRPPPYEVASPAAHSARPNDELSQPSTAIAHDVRRLFDQADTNHDGVLNKDEFAKLMARVTSSR